MAGARFAKRTSVQGVSAFERVQDAFEREPADVLCGVVADSGLLQLRRVLGLESMLVGDTAAGLELRASHAQLLDRVLLQIGAVLVLAVLQPHESEGGQLAARKVARRHDDLLELKHDERARQRCGLEALSEAGQPRQRLASREILPAVGEAERLEPRAARDKGLDEAREAGVGEVRRRVARGEAVDHVVDVEAPEVGALQRRRRQRRRRAAQGKRDRELLQLGEERACRDACKGRDVLRVPARLAKPCQQRRAALPRLAEQLGEAFEDVAGQLVGGERLEARRRLEHCEHGGRAHLAPVEVEDAEGGALHLCHQGQNLLVHSLPCQAEALHARKERERRAHVVGREAL
mmetsp:Transcript_38995/g.125923  ORF Transcript_38995/g.125923 Transcript_38995/m.125923 type:complete len:349 (-) Transcript_38995:491-1537(-)